MIGGFCRRAGAIAVLAFVGFTAFPAAATAATQSIETGAAPVIRIFFPQGKVRVIAWNRPSVSIKSANRVEYRSVPSSAVRARLPRSLRVPGFSANTPNGPVNLPAESFVMPALSPGTHNGLVLHGSGQATIHVPRDTAVLFASVGRGQLAFNGLRATTLVGMVRFGGIRLQNVTGTAFVQTLRGPIVANNSSFARIRARSIAGNVAFSRCNVQQIAASSVHGSILYDNGRFQPGLARFESQTGSVAIGIAHGSNAQINSHSVGGSAQRSFAGGGPVVTASSARGNVFVYDGSLRNHPRLAARTHAFDAPIFRRALGKRARPQRRNQRRYTPPKRRRATHHRPPG